MLCWQVCCQLVCQHVLLLCAVLQLLPRSWLGLVGQLLSGLNAGYGAQIVYAFDRSTTGSYAAKIRQSHKTCPVTGTVIQHCLVAAAGKGVHPTLRYRDTDGNIFSETTNSFGRSETTSLLTATPSTSTSTQSTTPDASQSEPDSPSARSASQAASDSDSEKEEEVVSHLQRLQGLAGSWRRHNKRPRLGRDFREGVAGQQGEDDVPEAAAMQVYVHGINAIGLQSALEKSSLWHRIGLNNNLEVRMLLLLLAVPSMSAWSCETCCPTSGTGNSWLCLRCVRLLFAKTHCTMLAKPWHCYWFA